MKRLVLCISGPLEWKQNCVLGHLQRNEGNHSLKKQKQNKIKRREEDDLKREMQRSHESLVSKWDVIFFFRYHNIIFHVFIKTETSLSFSLRLFFLNVAKFPKCENSAIVKKII